MGRLCSRNRQDIHDSALEVSVVASAIQQLVDDGATWEGTATDLLEALEAIVGEKAAKAKAWPKSPRSMSGHLKRIAPNLRAVGIGVEFGRSGRKRLIRIGTQLCVTSVTNAESAADPCDANDAKKHTASVPLLASAPSEHAAAPQDDDW